MNSYAAEWEVFLQDLVFGMVNQSNRGLKVQTDTVSVSKRRKAVEMYGDPFLEILQLKKKLHDRKHLQDGWKRMCNEQHTPYYAKQDQNS